MMVLFDVTDEKASTPQLSRDRSACSGVPRTLASVTDHYQARVDPLHTDTLLSYLDVLDSLQVFYY